MPFGAPGLGAAFSLANAAGRFEQAVASAGAIAGATAEELTRLHDAAIEAGLATQFSPTQATQALQELAAAGFNVGRALHELGRQGRVNAADSDGRRGLQPPPTPHLRGT